MGLEHEDFEKILNIGIRLTKEKDRHRILCAILENAMEITNCDAGTLYLYEEGVLAFRIMKTLSRGISRGTNGEPITDMPPVPMKEENVCAYTAIHREIVNIPDVYNSSCFDFSGPKQYDALTGYHTRSQLVIPLEDNEEELLGVLQLINALDEEGNVISFDPQYHIIIRSLGSMAAIELTNRAYMEELKAQLYSFVEAFTTALDERTPYNASHTRNVEKYVGIMADHIARMHREGKCDEDFDAERKERLKLAALLHDIGKMVVPLGIMNRATRLAGGMERVDARFALLKSFYEIDMLRGRITEEAYERQKKDLDAELALIHKIDGMGYLSDEEYERVCRLAEKKHVKEDGTVTPYITEKEKEYLMIRRGTLTEADRKEMENHVVMTEKILGKVHFHKNFASIKRWASSHHEYLDGSGYPEHLTGKELEPETRILSIADIYDALTAADRPYKNPMTRDEAVLVLRNMAAEGKLDAKLVEWFAEALAEERPEDKKRSALHKEL